MKKLLIAIALGLFVLNYTACTSNHSSEDQEVAAEDSESVDAQLESSDSTESTASNDQFVDDQLSGNLETQEKPSEVAKSENVQTEPVATETAPTNQNTVNAAVDPGSEKQAFVESPIAEPVAKSDPLHFKSTPFKVDGKVMNAVYVFRPKDTFLKISKNIYGNEKHVSDLKKWNPDLKSPQPGDKIYYNSPSRPEDESRLLSFYEDTGVVPDVYITKEGDSLKGISKQLLGYKNAWKEVYASNSLSNQDTLPAGTEIRYWKGSFAFTDSVATNQSSFSEVAAAPVKKVKKSKTKTKKFTPVENNNDFASTPPPMDMPPPPPVENVPPPPAPTMAQNDMPAPPPVANTQPADLPPPPPVEATPPAVETPPPAPPVAEAPKADEQPPAIEEASDDSMYYYAGGGLALVGVLGFVIARKRKQQQEMANAFNNDSTPSA